MLTHYEHKHAKGMDLSGHSGKSISESFFCCFREYEKCLKYQFLQDGKSVACKNPITIILKPLVLKIVLILLSLGTVIPIFYYSYILVLELKAYNEHVSLFVLWHFLFSFAICFTNCCHCFQFSLDAWAFFTVIRQWCTFSGASIPSQSCR